MNYIKMMVFGSLKNIRLIYKKERIQMFDDDNKIYKKNDKKMRTYYNFYLNHNVFYYYII